jgi:hypothetical protein
VSDARELLDAVDTVVRSLQRSGVSYFVTGSVASSMHGEYRATNDVDVVAALSSSDIASFIADMSEAFVADLEQAHQALVLETSFNLIHRSSFLKVDVFPLVTSFDRSAAERADVVMLTGATAPLRIATREDILLAKLRWYRMGAESSEVQRRDIAALIALNRANFDMAYVEEWATRLNVRDLLVRFLDRRP